jgi:hypothetical protein
MNKFSSLNKIASAATVTLAVFAAGSAFAQTGVSADGAKTRAQVTAELRAAQASGEYAALNGGDYRVPFVVQATQPGKTRAQVQAELAAARASGEYAALNGGDYREAFPVQSAEPGKSRAQVRDELAAARVSGEYPVQIEVVTL